MSEHDTRTSTPDQEKPAVEYRDVSGFPGYRVGDDGSVWSLWVERRRVMGQEWRRLKPSRNRDGYVQYSLSGGGRKKTVPAHRLVLEAFVGPCPPGMECLHADDDKDNCRLGNLSWGTRRQNMIEASARGMLSHKITNQEAEQVIRDYESGLYKQAELAERHGVSVTTIGDIVRGRRLVNGVKREPGPDRRFRGAKMHHPQRNATGQIMKKWRGS